MLSCENLLDASYRFRKTLLDKTLGTCLLYTSDAADERSSVDLGGRRIIKKKKTHNKRAHSDKQDKHNTKTLDKWREVVKER